MTKISRLHVFSFGKFLALLGALIGLLCGVIYSFGGLFVDTLVTLGWLVTDETPGLSIGSLMAFGALVAMPILAAGSGFVLGIIGALLFNIASRHLGGIRLNFD